MSSHASSRSPRAGWARPAPWILAAGALACVLWAVPTGAALVAGIAMALILADEEAGRLGARLAQPLLKISVVGLGAGMNLGVICRVGAQGVGYTVVSIGLTLAAGLWLGRRMRLHPDPALLISAGTAICGGSAIAAVAGVIKPKPHDITVALTTVFLLNAVALLVFPGIGHALGFSERQFGLWAALAIHDTSSVVGAALSYGHEALNVATTVKLTRALWIIPVAIAIGLSRGKGAGPRRLPVPAFIVGFVAAAALFTYCAPLGPWRLPTTAAAQRLFAVTLFLVGGGFSREALRNVGARPLVVGVALWIGIAVATAGALAAGWIR